MTSAHSQPLLKRDDWIALGLLSLFVVIYIAPVFSPWDAQSSQEAFRSHD